MFACVRDPLSESFGSEACLCKSAPRPPREGCAGSVSATWQAPHAASPSEEETSYGPCFWPTGASTLLCFLGDQARCLRKTPKTFGNPSPLFFVLYLKGNALP